MELISLFFFHMHQLLTIQCLRSLILEGAAPRPRSIYLNYLFTLYLLVQRLERVNSWLTLIKINSVGLLQQHTLPIIVSDEFDVKFAFGLFRHIPSMFVMFTIHFSVMNGLSNFGLIFLSVSVSFVLIHRSNDAHIVHHQHHHISRRAFIVVYWFPS